MPGPFGMYGTTKPESDRKKGSMGKGRGKAMSKPKAERSKKGKMKKVPKPRRGTR